MQNRWSFKITEGCVQMLETRVEIRMCESALCAALDFNWRLKADGKEVCRFRDGGFSQISKILQRSSTAGSNAVLWSYPTGRRGCGTISFAKQWSMVCKNNPVWKSFIPVPMQMRRSFDRRHQCPNTECFWSTRRYTCHQGPYLKHI